MKGLLILLSVLSFSVSAATIKETISQIEMEKQVRCDEYKKSVRFCLVDWCRFSVKYQCFGSEETFKVKLKVREVTGYSDRGRVTTQEVLNVRYLK